MNNSGLVTWNADKGSERLDNFYVCKTYTSIYDYNLIRDCVYARMFVLCSELLSIHSTK